MIDDFCAFILTHGRPDRVYTYETLKRHGYTGPIRLIVDDEDESLSEYQKRFGDQVVVFSKAEVEGTFDVGDNFEDRRAVVYARNACFGIARDLGYKYFVQLDDDYMTFSYRFEKGGELLGRRIKDLDRVLSVLLEYYKSIPVLSIALAQMGDFLAAGRDPEEFMHSLRRRKAMNSFICSVARSFEFTGRINEDVNAYVGIGARGGLFLTMSQVALNQKTTQKSVGGLTDIYLSLGTYVKSFYTILYSPSCVQIRMMGGTAGNKARIHHRISWPHAVPQIIREKYRKVAGEYSTVNIEDDTHRSNSNNYTFLKDSPKKQIISFLSSCRSLGICGEGILELSSGNRNKKEALLNRWYKSLHTGVPDYEVYSDPAYIVDLWDCWKEYSRKHLRSITKNTQLLKSIGSVYSVVDLGCGFGYTTKTLSEIFPRAEVFGTNIPGAPQTRIAESLGVHVCGSAQEIKSPVDLVFASEYFEHFLEPIEHLLEVFSSLSPRVMLVANSFGTRAIGHFQRYVVNGRSVSGKEASRLFNREMRRHGFASIKVGLWNNRPAYWRSIVEVLEPEF